MAGRIWLVYMWKLGPAVVANERFEALRTHGHGADSGDSSLNEICTFTPTYKAGLIDRARPKTDIMEVIRGKSVL